MAWQAAGEARSAGRLACSACGGLERFEAEASRFSAVALWGGALTRVPEFGPVPVAAGAATALEV